MPTAIDPPSHPGGAVRSGPSDQVDHSTMEETQITNGSAHEITNETADSEPTSGGTPAGEGQDFNPKSPEVIDSTADLGDGYKGLVKENGDNEVDGDNNNEDEDDEDADHDVEHMKKLVAELKEGPKMEVVGAGEDDVEDVGSQTLSEAISQAWDVPDGGWGWVIVVCALVISLIVDGLTYTFGILLSELESVFQKPKSTISLASSLQVGIYLMVGPIVSALTNRFGCRPVIIAGSFLAGLAYIVSAWSNDVTTFILTYGVCGGIGFGMMYLPAIVAVSVYFEERRAFATGFAVCGSGIGTFILAPLTDYLLFEYNWSWTLLLQAGLVLNGMVFGALVRPLDLKRHKEDDEDDNLKDDVSRKSSSPKPGSKVEEEIILLADTKKRRKHRVSTSSSTSRTETMPMITITDDQENTTIMLQDPGKGTKPGESPGRFFSSTPNIVINSTSQLAKVVSKKGGNKRPRTSSTNSSEQPVQRGRANTLDTIMRVGRQRTQSTSGRSNISGSSRVRAHAPVGLAFISLSDAQLNKIRDDVHLPLSRRDIHLSGPLAHPDWHHKIPRGERGLGLYIQSVKSITSIGKEEEVSKPAKGLWACLPASARDTLQEMLNLSILKDLRYWFVLLGNFFCMIGFYVPFVYVPVRAKEIGISEEKTAFLLSIIGITNTIGRVMTGVVMNFFDIDTVLVTTLALGSAGVVTALCPLCDTYWSLALASAVFGVCVAAYISLCSVLLCELLGVENLTNAFGFVILFRGVACIMGPPIAGAIIDGTGLFDPAFFVGGGMIIMGAISHSVLLSPCVRNRRSNPG